MENATKALIIAGAVLISILLISVGIMVFNAANAPIEQSQNSSEQQAVQIFNEPILSNLGPSITYQQVRSLVSAIHASNSKNTDHQITINTQDASNYKLGNLSSRSKYSAVETITNGYITDVTISASSNN